MVARAAISQFEPGSFRIERLPKVTSPEQLRDIVRSHCGRHCIFLYTLVQRDLLEEMQKLCDEGINGIDLLGPSVGLLERCTGLEPIREAGIVRRTDEFYFDRIEAMEFAVKHDDGRNPEGLIIADVVLIGVSRTSKTPLAMYLAFKGIRCANVPLAPGVNPPHELFEVDPRRVFGLVTGADTLIEIRRERMRELGTFVKGYTDMESIQRELDEARSLMRRIGCLVIRTENRAVEESAQEIMRHLQGALATGD